MSEEIISFWCTGVSQQAFSSVNITLVGGVAYR